MRKAAMWVAAAAIAVGTLVVPASPARAFDRGSCDSYMSSNVEAVDRFRIDDAIDVDQDGHGAVAFGDHPYWADSPQGTAVVCWGDGGEAAVLGQLFWDDPKRSTPCMFAHVTFFVGSTAVYSYDAGRLRPAHGDFVQVFTPELYGDGVVTRVRLRIGIAVDSRCYYTSGDRRSHTHSEFR